MSSLLDLGGLAWLRDHHPAWRLLGADHAPFVISFLHRVFVADQRRQVAESDLLHRLDDHLFAARAANPGDYRRTAAEYLAHWSADACGWLRASYVSGSDEPVYDLTLEAERAIEWLVALRRRDFVGTESRLLTIVELLRQIRDGSEVDPEARVRELEERKAAIDAEIARVRAGEAPHLADVAVRDRFQLMAATARALLTDLREVEQNIRLLDREARTRIAQWDGGKGTLLSEILGNRDAIAESDQGRSFRAFWDFLMTPQRQEEFDSLLGAVLALPAVREASADPRLPRIRFDWLGAGEQAQRTVARLSEQLRRFLDDRAALENRRIAQLIREVERHASAVREAPPDSPMAIDALVPEFSLPCDRPLFTPPLTVRIAEQTVALGIADDDLGALYQQVYVDPERLADQVRRCLVDADDIALPQVLAQHPLVEGLAELVGYLRLATDNDGRVRATVHDHQRDTVDWLDRTGCHRQATLPHIVFTR